MVDPDGLSYLKYNGETHLVALYSKSGKKLGTFTAYNRVALHHNGHVTSGPMTNGVHKIYGPDRHGAVNHLGNSSNGAYGKNGDIRVVPYKGIRGNMVSGGALHAGRENKGGPKHPTLNCIRTTPKGMASINSTAKNDPLTTLTVEHNDANIKNWETKLQQWNKRNHR